MTRVAVVLTVLNERESIGAVLESIQRQSVQPDEVVVVDGGSTDGTWERLRQASRLQLIRAPGTSIARGRNVGIEAATSDVIAVTDAGVRLEPDWLERLLDRLEPGVDVVSGFFRPDPHSVFETAMGATVLPDATDVTAETFLPSSRSVLFRKAAWQAVGGYPDWLDYCEDLVFDLALRKAGYRFVFQPEAVAWFRPRGSLSAFYRQYWRYARGDGKADLWRGRHAIRYATYLTLLGLFSRPSWRRLLLVLFGVAVYTRRPYQRLWPALSAMRASEQAYAVMLVPVIRLVGDLAKMLGYPVGVAWRISRSSS